MSNPDILVDNVVKFKMFSFMDEFSEYNQIFMTPEDEENLSFYRPIGVYYYMMMLFSLQNIGATYQWAMLYIFANILHIEMEDYVDAIIVKLRSQKNHYKVLRLSVTLMQSYQLEAENTKMCFWCLIKAISQIFSA